MDQTKELEIVYSEKDSDFLPYADTRVAWFTGLYTTNPQFKFFARRAGQVVRAMNKLISFEYLKRESATLWGNYTQINGLLEEFEKSVASCQHSNAITGTARDSVLKSLQRDVTRCYEYLQFIISMVVNEMMETRFEEALEFV